MLSRETIKTIFGGLKPKGEAKENQPTVSADIVLMVILQVKQINPHQIHQIKKA